MKSVISTAPLSADWLGWFSVVTRTLVGGGVLPLCRDAADIFYSHLLYSLDVDFNPTC